jgi:hypothetical protein
MYFFFLKSTRIYDTIHDSSVDRLHDEDVSSTQLD